MNRIAQSAALLATVFTATAANADVVDLGGLEFWGPDGDEMNGTRSFQLAEPGLTNGFGYIILEIRYNLFIDVAPGSTFDNLNIRYGNTDGTFHGNWPDSFQPAPGFFGDGIGQFSGSIYTDIHLNPDGLFHVELFEGKDDGLFGPDAVLLEGSSFELVQFIPTPGTANIILFGALASCTRRRR